MGNLTIAGASLVALAATTALTPAAATTFPGGIYVFGNVTDDQAWLAQQNAWCGGADTRCVFLATSHGTFVVNGLSLALKWSDWAPCLATGTTCLDAFGNSNTVVPTNISVTVYNRTGNFSSTFTLSVGIQQNLADTFLANIATIESARQKLISNSGGSVTGSAALSLGLGMIGGNYTASCASSPCEPGNNGQLPQGMPAAAFQYNTPMWVVSTIAGHNAYASGAVDGSVMNGFIYTTEYTTDPPQRCFLAPAPWGDIYSQLQVNSYETFLSYVAAKHKISVVKLAGLNGNDLEIAVSGWGTTSLSGCTYSGKSPADSGGAGWLSLENYTTAKVEKAFQYYVHAITSYVAGVRNMGPGTSFEFMMVSAQNMPPIDTTGALLTGDAAGQWPIEFTSQLIFDLFGGVSTSGTAIPAVNTLLNTTIPPFNSSTPPASVIPSSLNITQFAVQTDGLIDSSSCYFVIGFCSGNETQSVLWAPSTPASKGNAAPGSLFSGLINCQLNNIAQNEISSSTTYATQLANTGPRVVSGLNGSTLNMALGFQDYPHLVSTVPTYPYSSSDSQAALQTAQLAAVFGGNYVEMWGNGLSAMASNGALGSLGSTAAALSAGNAAGCEAGANQNR